MTLQPSWSDVLSRYRTSTRLHTRSRKAGFTAVALGNTLRVIPESTGRPRNLTKADFELSVPLLDRAGRGEVNEASRNSSYIEAILADLRRLGGSR